MANEIVFFSCLGPCCPLCGERHCYRQITPYWRYAIELFPEFQKKRIPIARFLCQRQGKTFSLLPVQLIPYFQYTVATVIETLLLAFEWRQIGQRGFWGASVHVAPDSEVTPWLVAYWLKVVLRGFRRAHADLIPFYDLRQIQSLAGSAACEEASGYFEAFGLKREPGWRSWLTPLLHRYSRATRYFLFGTPSQQRV